MVIGYAILVTILLVVREWAQYRNEQYGPKLYVVNFKRGARC